jgi:SAM-dependent methyltransferase
MTFSEYSKFYDLLYRDKQYNVEFENILKRIPMDGIENVLELGCGTGTYSSIAADCFKNVTAIDLSEDMIKLACLKNQKPNIKYTVKDLRGVDFTEKFEFIFSLFHVFSYLTTLESLNEAIEAASNHMKIGSFFCFDVWSSAGFVKNKLEIRRKEELSEEGSRIIRYSYSSHNPHDETILVNFDFIIFENTVTPQFFQEQHLMKYWSKDAICATANKFGLVLVETFDLHTGKEVTNDSFGVTYLFRKEL